MSKNDIHALQVKLQQLNSNILQVSLQCRLSCSPINAFTLFLAVNLESSLNHTHKNVSIAIFKGV